MTDNHIDDIHTYRRQLVERKLWLDQLIKEAEERMRTRRTFPVRYQDTLRGRLRELIMLRHEVQSEIDEVSVKQPKGTTEVHEDGSVTVTYDVDDEPCVECGSNQAFLDAEAEAQG